MNLSLFSALLLVLTLSSIFNSVLGSFQPLQVSVNVNGYSVPAIIDTGAEVTVMSLSCAKRCRLAEAIDTRHSGTAVGIGSTDIVGRIDDLELKLGDTASISNKIAVLRQSKCDFILGLDVLQKHNCDISFKNNRLRMTVKNKTVKIPLLSSKIPFDPEEIAESANYRQQDQPSIVKQKILIDVRDPDDLDEESDFIQEEGEPISMAGV